MGGRELVSSGSWNRKVASCGERCNELSSSIKCEKFVEYLFKKDSVPWNFLICYACRKVLHFERNYMSDNGDNGWLHCLITATGCMICISRLFNPLKHEL